MKRLWEKSFFYINSNNFKGRSGRMSNQRFRKQGKGKFSQGKGEAKTCDDSSTLGKKLLIKTEKVNYSLVCVCVCVRVCVCARLRVCAGAHVTH